MAAKKASKEAQRKLRQMKVDIRAFDQDTKKAIMNNPEYYKEYSHQVAKRLRKTINRQMSGRDWGQGKQNSTGIVRPTSTKNRASVSWTGRYIKFIEFGTGVMGVENPYPLDLTGATMSPMRGYKPQAFTHPNNYRGEDKREMQRQIRSIIRQTVDEDAKLGEYWLFRKQGTLYFSHGWEPLMPFYLTVRNEHMLAYNKFSAEFKRLVKENAKKIGKAAK